MLLILFICLVFIALTLSILLSLCDLYRFIVFIEDRKNVKTTKGKKKLVE